MMNFISKSLMNKLLVLLLVASLAPIAIVGYLSFNSAKSSLEQAKLTELEAVADLKVDRIEAFFKDVEDDIRITQDYFNIRANLPIVTRFANDRTNPEFIAAKEMLDGQLKAWLSVKSEMVDDLMLVSPEGKIVYVANEEHEAADLDKPLPVLDNRAFEEGKNEVYISDIFRSELEEGELHILVTAPAYDFDGNFIGVIALEIDMEPIYEFIQDTTGLGETGETLIGKKIGNEVVFLNPLRHDPDAALKRKVVIGSDEAIPIQEAVQGIGGTGYTVDYRGEEIIAHWEHIPSMDWGLVAKIDTKEAFAPVKALKLKTILIAVFTGALVALTAYFAARTIADPLTEVSEKAAKIAEGDLTVNMPSDNRQDEIGVLASNFNLMVEKLQKRVEELEEFHSITVGRELKMIELEKEIERLKEDLKKAGGNV